MDRKSNVLCAENIYTKDAVVLKFYFSRSQFENSRSVHKRLQQSNHVSKFVPLNVSGSENLFRDTCRLLDTFDEGGPSPCLVFERGDVSLDKWIANTNPGQFQKKEALFQV